MYKLFLFLGRCLGFVLRGTTQHADHMQIWGALLIPTIGIAFIFQTFSPLMHLLSLQMPENPGLEYYPYFLGIALIAWIVLRAIAAPFFVWRDEHDNAMRLEQALAEPEYIERKLMAKHIADTKARIASAAATMVARACDPRLWRDNGMAHTERHVDYIDEYKEALDDLEAGVEELSYIPKLRETGKDLAAACGRLKDDFRNNVDFRPSQSEVYKHRTEFMKILHVK